MSIGTEHVPLSHRVCEIRRDRYVESGGPSLAEALGLPARTWADDEFGVVIPAPIIPRFQALTGAGPAWLLTGEGDRYLSVSASRRRRHAGQPHRGVGA